MAELAKKFEPAKGVENLTITVSQNVSEGTSLLTISDWPYETDDDSVISTLRGSSNVVEAKAEKRATAAAIRKAQELGVEVVDVPPSGSDGSVTVDDVEKHGDSS